MTRSVLYDPPNVVPPYSALWGLVGPAGEGEQKRLTKLAIMEHLETVEANLMDAVCDKLVDRGRIMPGEPLLDIPDWNGSGKTRYCFP